MSDLLKYRGYEGSVEYSAEDACLIGRVLHINSLIGYAGDTVTEIQAMFEQAVNEYLAMCEEKGIAPDKPYKGSLNVRLGADLHREAAQAAVRKNISLNEWIIQAVRNYVSA
ncbi:MAG: type II toxin-antitoxin system HicB family antitoxin [Neisseriaceae bacterium]|nr:type II toxin-antitoxin system HicB family antitoxin [Neisseriaceae bacterium]